jgi:hypothetical protein
METEIIIPNLVRIGITPFYSQFRPGADKKWLSTSRGDHRLQRHYSVWHPRSSLCALSRRKSDIFFSKPAFVTPRSKNRRASLAEHCAWQAPPRGSSIQHRWHDQYPHSEGLTGSYEELVARGNVASHRRVLLGVDRHPSGLLLGRDVEPQVRDAIHCVAPRRAVHPLRRSDAARTRSARQRADAR